MTILPFGGPSSIVKRDFRLILPDRVTYNIYDNSMTDRHLI